MNEGAGHEHVELERRLGRVESWLDARLVTKDVFEIHMKNQTERLDKTDENITWLVRLVVVTAVGVVGNVILYLLR